jgi:GTPase Era involved in 16S rRNA processing
MENPDLDVEISYCKVKLKEISMEYNNTMICEWPTVRERELYFYRELSKLQKLRKNKEAVIEHLETNKNMVILVKNKPEEINDKEKQNDEDEQWEINEKKYYQTASKKKRKKSPLMKQLKKYLIMML